VSRVRAFARFWWDFVVGDDWRVAAGLAAAIALTWVLEHFGIAAWWLLPGAVALLLASSVRREVRQVRLPGPPHPPADGSSA
jgi:di/tricarboxylate transporter